MLYHKPSNKSGLALKNNYYNITNYILLKYYQTFKIYSTKNGMRIYFYISFYRVLILYFISFIEKKYILILILIF